MTLKAKCTLMITVTLNAQNILMFTTTLKAKCTLMITVTLNAQNISMFTTALKEVYQSSKQDGKEVC